MYIRIVKPVCDFLVAAIAFLLLIPVFLTIGFAILVTMGSPVLFIQERPGKNERIFRLYKFRTMTREKDINGNLLPDYKRLTTVGGFLRRSGLDEIPQLFNVLKGDISVVGPRPLLTEYLPLYSIEQRKRHIVKPGITGWAQVNGRNSISWEEKFELDVFYVKHISFALDIKIIFLTVTEHFLKSGKGDMKGAIMDKYKGSMR